MISKYSIFLTLVGAALSTLVLVRFATAGETFPSRVTLASTPESIPTVRTDGQLTDPERPGFRVVLLREAGKTCGAEILFSTMPWPRVLESVRNGSVNGAFSASYSDERAAFAVFPMREGQPDPTRAMREQIYYLYVPSDVNISLEDGRPEPAVEKVVVERDSVGVSLAKSLGVDPIEVANYLTMVRMIAERRERAMLGVDHHVRAATRREPLLAPRIRQITPAVSRFSSYVIFGKQFYQDHTKFVECFWKAVERIRATTEYRELVRSYNEGDFIE